jgi:hypothetical protein
VSRILETSVIGVPALPQLPALPRLVVPLSAAQTTEASEAKHGVVIALSLVIAATVIPVIWTLAAQPTRPRRRRRH